MDRQILPTDWSACNEAINSDFTNANMFWFSHDTLLSDGQVDFIYFLVTIDLSSISRSNRMKTSIVVMKI